MKPKLVLFIPAVIWFIIIFILLTVPNADLPKAKVFDLIHFDKWVHISLFGGQTVLICLPFFKTKTASLSLFIKVAILVSLYGVAMEFVQKYFTKDRSFDIWDMTADAVGTVLACMFLNIIYKMYLRKQARRLL